MIALLLAVAVASSPPAVPSSAVSVPPVLEGTDTLPRGSAVGAVPVDALVAVVVDARQTALLRARAARLLGGRAVGDTSLDVVLHEVLGGARGPFAAQLTLALADRAGARRDRAALRRLADDALGSDDADVARAGVLVWWRLGGPEGRSRLEQTGRSHADASVRGACRGRLRQWHRSGQVDGSDDGTATVVDPRHGGPPPAR